nr:hypothetical protein [Tanacetum cinerariifolium]
MNQEEIQQAACKEAWVPKDNKVKISTTNMRINPTMTQKKETYQVVLDIIKNTTFYKAFLATADVPDFFMQFAKIIINHFLFVHKSVPKGLTLGLHTIKDGGVLSQIKFVKIREEVQEYGKSIPNMMLTEAIKKSEAYKAFIGYFIGLAPPKKTRSECLKGKQQEVTTKKKIVFTIDDNIITDDPDKRLLVKKHEESDGELAHRVTRRRRTRGVTFSDTPRVLKKKLVVQSQKLKGIQPLTVKEQLAADTMQALKASKNSSKSLSHTEGSCEGTGITPGVPDESIVIFTTSSEGTDTIPGVPEEVKGASEAKVDSAIDWGSENERREDEQADNDDRSINIEKTGDEEETNDEFVHDDEFVHGNVDEEMKDAEVAKTRKDDEEITDAEKTDANKIEVTKGDLEQTGKLPLTSSSLSVPYRDQFTVGHSKPTRRTTYPVVSVILDPTFLSLIPEIPIVTLVTTLPPPPSVTNITHVLQQQTTPILTPPLTTAAPAATTVLDQLPTIVQRVPAAVDKYLGQVLEMLFKRCYRNKSSLLQTMTESKSFNKHPSHKALYHALMESLLADKEGMDQGVADSLMKKIQHDDQDKDPSVRPNQGKKSKRRRIKESDLSKNSSTSKRDTPPKTSKSDKPMHAEEEPRNDWFTQPPRPPTPDPVWNKGKEVDDGQEQTWFNDLLSTENIELKYNMDECYKSLSDQLDWKNLERDHCPFDLSKPLHFKGCPCHLTIALKYFFNNNLEYLKSSDPKKKYTMSITKTMAARYELILSVKSVTVNKLHGYGYLEEIVVGRAYRQLYKFKEGDFVNLHLNDIEDMLLLVVQHKLFHLDGEVIVDLAVALRMFTRSFIIKKRVEDVQLGVKSYEKKINITKPQKDFPGIYVKELYTPSFDPPRVVYVDLINRKRLLRADELSKFLDGTIKKVCDTLHHKLLNFRHGYDKDMPRRKWSATDEKRAGIMEDLIDKLMLERWTLGI